MPISIEAFRKPSFTRYETRYPISYNKEDRFNEINPRHDVARYRGDQGREGGWKQAGYNPNHQTTSIERIAIRTDDITLRPY
jgi:hypothetical protein